MIDNLDELLKQSDEHRFKEKIKNVPLTKYPLNKTELNMLPYNELEDVVLLICEFANDIVNQASILGYLDNLPMVYAAWTGKEQVIPQLKDLTTEEYAELSVKVKDKLELSASAEKVVDKALAFLWSGKELVDSIQEAKG